MGIIPDFPHPKIVDFAHMGSFCIKQGILFYVKFTNAGRRTLHRAGILKNVPNIKMIAKKENLK